MQSVRRLDRDIMYYICTLMGGCFHTGLNWKRLIVFAEVTAAGTLADVHDALLAHEQVPAAETGLHNARTAHLTQDVIDSIHEIRNQLQAERREEPVVPSPR